MTIKIGSKIEKLNPGDTYKLIDGADVAGFSELAQQIGAATRFTSLTDTPDTYPPIVVNKRAFLRTNITSDKLEFVESTMAEALSDVNIVTPEPGDILVYTAGGWQNESPLSPISSKVYGPNGATSGIIVEDTSNIVFYRNAAQSAINTPRARDGDLLWIFNENTDAAHFVSVIPDGVTVNGATDVYTVGKNKEVGLVYNASADNWAVALVRDYAISDGLNVVGLQADGTPISVSSLKNLSFPNATVNPQANNSALITPFLKLSKLASAVGDEGSITELRYLPPLKATIPLNAKYSAALEIDDRAYLPTGNSSYLAYLTEEEYLRGRVLGSGVSVDGSIGLGSVVYTSGPHITGDINTRSVTIEKAYDDDSHSRYLIAATVGLIGQAPAEGYIRAYVRETQGSGGIHDINDQPLAYQKNYKLGDRLGIIAVVGIIERASETTDLQLVVETNFTQSIQIGDRVTGPTSLLVQGLSTDISTSPAANQWQHDVGMALRYAKHAFGDDLSDFYWLLKNETAGELSAPAGQKIILAGGYHFHPVAAAKYLISVGNVQIQNNPEASKVDYSFGKVFSAEKTKLLIERDIRFSYQSSINLLPTVFALYKWTGAPDKYLEPIFLSRNASEVPILQPGWVLVDSVEQGEGVTGVVEHTFNVPADAVNFAVILYPKFTRYAIDITSFYRFELSVDPFVGYVMYPLLNADEQLARYAATRVVTNMGDFSTRRLWFYVSSNTTGNPKGGPLPVGVVDTGYDLVKVDSSFHVMPGTVGNEVKGMGALVFQKAGTVTISTELHLYTASNAGIIDRATFWYSKVTNTVGPVLQKIAESETEIPVWGGLEETTAQTGRMITFTLKVQAGDMIVLRGSTPTVNTVYIEAKSPLDWMLHSNITYNSFT